MFPNRISRVESLLAREISLILEKQRERLLQLGEGTLLTLTGVCVARNLEHAVIYYSWVSSAAGDDRISAASKPSISPQQSKNVEDFLVTEIQPRLIRALKERVVLKRLPRLRFEYDATLQRADKVYSILENLKKEKQ